MKPSVSSDCSSGGSTATMSSTTTSLIGCTLLSMETRSMQSWRLQQLGAVDRTQHHVEGDALMVDRERHVDAGSAERPELSVEAGLAGDLVAVDREDDVAGLEFGARRRSLAGDADHHDAVVDFGGVHAEPRPRRPVDAADFPDVVEHGLQQIDRHDHVDVLGPALALAFELQ